MADDEPKKRTKRGAESDLHQDNWNDDDDDNEGEVRLYSCGTRVFA